MALVSELIQHRQMMKAPEPHGEIGAHGTGRVKDAPLGAPLRGDPYGVVLDAVSPVSRLASMRLRRRVSGAEYQTGER